MSANAAHAAPPRRRAGGCADRIRCRLVFILLPPSETKAIGGDPDALDLDSLLFPELRKLRGGLISALGRLSRNPSAARSALGVSAAKDAEIAANTLLCTAPTLPAVARYTGVLYDALDVTGMTSIERSRAEGRLLIASALFGVVRAADRIPAYRLSAGSQLPGLGTIAAQWRPSLSPLLASLDGPVVDLRSGAYAAFADVPGAIGVRVVTERPDGSQAVVSHFSKHTKGRLARVLAASRAGLEGPSDILRVARRAGLRVERVGDRALQIVT